jgi:hypothetical protein
MNETSCVVVGSRRNREEASRLVREFEQSGMRRAAFCRVQGIALSTLDYYRRKHGSQEGRNAAQIVPVELVGPSPALGSHLRVELANGRRIAVEEGFDAMLLKRLIAALEG